MIKEKQGLESVNHSLLRELPSVDALLNSDGAQELVKVYGRSLTTAAYRQTLAAAREAIKNGRQTTPPTSEQLNKQAQTWLKALTEPTLKPVINATGVIIHTNLGRAPLSNAAIQAISRVAAGYSTLEYDLTAGQRGSRSVHAEQLIRQITGAEAAHTVNNNAAAVLLMLTALCQGKEVIISRGQLVEIGGGFRVPDVMAQSGAILREVGTTNRTHLRDYEQAINENTAAILAAHHSNYKIIGFTTEPELAELAQLAHKHNLLMLYDQGSGALLDVANYGLDPEPTVLDGLQAGCDVVAFSGDKLLGGPQAGILVGKKQAIAACKKHPLARAVRADKLCLAGLSAALTHYLLGEAETAVPVWRMIAMTQAEIARQAQTWAAALQKSGITAEAIPSESTIGGGSTPGTTLPTTAVAITHPNVDELAAHLRMADHPVIGRIQDGRFLLDPRTVLPAQEETLLQTIQKTITQYPIPN
jgi:L-seryl-tRNA(Ser) seleniumtransferase